MRTTITSSTVWLTSTGVCRCARRSSNTSECWTVTSNVTARQRDTSAASAAKASTTPLTSSVTYARIQVDMHSIHRDTQKRTIEDGWTAPTPFFFPRRRPSLQVHPLREGLHPALLTGVPYEEDPQHHPDVRLQGAPQQAVRVRGVRPHVGVSGWSARAPALASSQQSPAEREDSQEDRRRNTCYDISSTVSTKRWKWCFQWISRPVDEWVTRTTTASMDPQRGEGGGSEWRRDEMEEKRYRRGGGLWCEHMCVNVCLCPYWFGK